MNIREIILAVTTILTALMAGLFYAWSCSVMLGFARLPDREFVLAMQEINRAIQNPVFFIAFFGAPVLLPISTFLYYGETPRFQLLVAATVIFLVGVFAVTLFGNVPLNNMLDRFDLNSASAEIAVQRMRFEGPWNNLNTIRTVSSTLALLMVILACLSSV